MSHLFPSQSKRIIARKAPRARKAPPSKKFTKEAERKTTNNVPQASKPPGDGGLLPTAAVMAGANNAPTFPFANSHYRVARRSSSADADVWAKAYEQVKDLVPPKVEHRRQGKLKSGFLNGFSTAACFAVASGGILPADKAHLDVCLQSLNPNQQEVFKKMESRLQSIAPFELTKAIGTWVGNTCSILSKDSHWETAEDLSSLPREKKPIWRPYKAALIAVKFSNVNV
jgi:hypothetical protein